MNPNPFHDRADAGRRLGERLKGLPLSSPIVLAIPRGGIEVGLPLAATLGADLDVILAHKIRCPSQPELALGAVSETGKMDISDPSIAVDPSELERERTYQLVQIERRRRLYRAARPPASLRGRSVIVTDDGIATGSTMIAALKAVRARHPHETIVAIPSPRRIGSPRSGPCATTSSVSSPRDCSEPSARTTGSLNRSPTSASSRSSVRRGGSLIPPRSPPAPPTLRSDCAARAEFRRRLRTNENRAGSLWCRPGTWSPRSASSSACAGVQPHRPG